MKTWHLIAVQVWVLCFTPVWLFMSTFSLMLLSPEPNWFPFILINTPPVLSIIGSIIMWVARFNQSVSLQKTMVKLLIILPPVCAITPFVLFD